MNRFFIIFLTNGVIMIFLTKVVWIFLFVLVLNGRGCWAQEFVGYLNKYNFTEISKNINESNVNTENKNGDTALHIVISALSSGTEYITNADEENVRIGGENNDQLEKIAELYEKILKVEGLNLEIVSNERYTVLEKACELKNKEKMLSLLEKGAKFDRKMPNDDLLIHMLVKKFWD